MYTSYALKTLLQLLVTLVAFCGSPFLAMLVDSDGNLPEGFLRTWFQTEDNTCDAGWKVQGNYGTYLTNGTVPTGFKLWLYRMYWLARNPAYGFCYWILGIPYVKDDWNILVNSMPSGYRIFHAETKDGKYFSFFDEQRNIKLGYKLWWGISALGPVPDVMPASTGGANLVPICFTV